MKSFKLTNKKKEQEKERENIEQQKKETNTNMQNENLNFIQKNPQTAGAIFIGFITYILIAINAGYIWVIPIIFGARYLSKARKIGENKKFIIVGNIVVLYIPILFFVLSIFAFVIEAINNVQ